MNDFYTSNTYDRYLSHPSKLQECKLKQQNLRQFPQYSLELLFPMIKNSTVEITAEFNSGKLYFLLSYKQLQRQ